MKMLLVAATAALAATTAIAAPIAVTSYDMPNGNGQASGGSFNYWDINYIGVGATTTDGAPLTGGTGDLTDGIIASGNWSTVENSTGTGPYVGWFQAATPNPLVTFNFAGNPTITGIGIHFDNSGISGVFAPGALLINGVATTFAAPPTGFIGTSIINGLNLTGNSLTIEFQQLHGTWTFVSEVRFDGTPGSNVPEPASWALLLTGFALAGTALRRRRALAA